MKSLTFICRQKIKVAQTQNERIKLQKNLMFISMPIIYFLTCFFSEILHLKESCNLIGWQLFGPDSILAHFVKYWIGGGLSTTILVSILDYFQEKLMTKFFKKSQKTLFWGHFGSSLPKFGRKYIFLENGAQNNIKLGQIIYNK